MDSIHQEDYKGYIIKIVPDDDPMDPREWDNLGTMVCRHKRYALGDKGAQNVSNEEFNELVSRKDVIKLPLYLYDHSGLRLNTSGFSAFDSQEWDWGMLGIIYVTHARVLKEYNRKRMSPKLKEKATEVLRGEVETYDQYLSGGVFGFVIYDGTHVVDSCFGFYGKMDYCIEQARGSVDGHIEEMAKWPIVSEKGIKAIA
jgi:hypothetical protein